MGSTLLNNAIITPCLNALQLNTRTPTADYQLRVLDHNAEQTANALGKCILDHTFCLLYEAFVSQSA
jgi:hypothetical protein